MDYIGELMQILSKICVSSEMGDFDYNKGMEYLVSVFLKHRNCNKRVFYIGNGGSAAIACHMTADFFKNGGMSTVSLYNASVITCLGNDYGYEYVFSKQLEMLMNEGDLLCAVSSSGNSQNIINALEMASAKRGVTISFTGFKPDNKARKMSDISVYVPCEKYGIVESIHNLMLQQVVDELMELK